MEKTYTKTIVKSSGTIRQSVVKVNKKGLFEYRPFQCHDCKFHGYAYLGIHNTGQEITCDRDIVTWREWKRSTKTPCKHYEPAEVV